MFINLTRIVFIRILRFSITSDYNMTLECEEPESITVAWVYNLEP